MLVVELVQQPVVHLVDVVAGQDQHVVGGDAVDEVQVLPDGVGGALVPVVAALHLGRHFLDELVQARGQEAEALGEVPAQRVRLVLGQDQDLADVGVDAVAEGEVDDPVDGPERNRGLGPDLRERPQPLAHPAGHDDCQYPLWHIELLWRRPQVDGNLLGKVRPQHPRFSGNVKTLYDKGTARKSGPSLGIRSNQKPTCLSAVAR